MIETKMYSERRCPYCGGILIWDYQRGDIICGSCGTVVDRIYISNRNGERRGLEPIKPPGITVKKTVGKTPKSYKLYMKLHSVMMASNRKLMINEERFKAYVEGRSGHINIFSSRNNQLSEKLLDSDDELRDIIENIVTRIPRLSSRTIRGKVTAALLIRMVYREKRSPGHKLFLEIAEKTGTSVSHVKRIYKLLESIRRNVR